MRGPVCAVADVHLGNHKRFGGPVEVGLNRRCRLALASFRLAAERAVANGASAFVVLGDLFDTDRPEPQLVTAVQGVLVYLKNHGVRSVLLVGNHDQTSDARGDHALGPLSPYAEVVDEPRVLRAGGYELGCVPYRPGNARDWLVAGLDALQWSNSRSRFDHAAWVPRVLCVHVGVRDADTPRWLREAPDAIDAAALAQLARERGVGHVLAGNWHDRRLWTGAGAEVFQLGALVPTGWDNPGLDYGTLAVLHGTGELRYEEVPGPRFVSVRSEEELRVRLAQVEALRTADGEGVYAAALYVSWQVRADRYSEAADALAGLVLRGKVTDGEVVLDEGEAEEQASAAAQAARGAGGLDAALEAYVAEVPLPEGVDRAAVLARCRGYLR